MLSDEDIRNAIQAKEIVIQPFEENSLTPVGYDLRVGNWAFSWKKKYKFEIDNSKPITIEPQETVVIESLESLTLSKKYGANVNSMVTKISFGLSHISTTIDPGWTGKCLITISNYIDTPIELEFQEAFCTVCFYEMITAAKKDLHRPPDREDIRTRLREKAKEEKDKLDKERKQEEERIKNKRNKRKIQLLSVCLIFTFISAVSYFLFGATVAAMVISSLTAVSVFLVEIFKE